MATETPIVAVATATTIMTTIMMTGITEDFEVEEEKVAMVSNMVMTIVLRTTSLPQKTSVPKRSCVVRNSSLPALLALQPYMRLTVYTSPSNSEKSATSSSKKDI